MALTPIVLFVYKRPWHTKQTVESLKCSSLTEESELYVFSDGPKNLQEKTKVEEVREYIKSIKGFKSVTISESKNNLGLANSVIKGVMEIIQKYQKAIVIEDDLIVSQNFLKFMNEALNFYKDDLKICSISGYAFPIKIPAEYEKDVYILPRSSSWGWGTWLDRWQKADWEVKDFNAFSKNKNLQAAFNKGGEDLTPMLKAQMSGKIDSWGIRWAYTHFKNNSYCLYPVKSFCRNIGIDDSGTHSRTSKKYDVDIINSGEINFTHDLILNEEILSATSKFVKPTFLRKTINMIRRK